MIVLVGFMGAGKSTVGRAVAERLGLRFVDVDEAVSERAGAGVPAIFERDGEAAFRVLEASAAADALTAGRDVVVALGGGALGDAATRTAVRSGTVVWLDVGLEEARRRADDESRPLFRRPGLEELYARRRAVYGEVADVVVRTDGLSADEVAARVTGAVLARDGGATQGAAPTRIPVPVPGGPYEVIVGPGLSARLGELLPELPRAEKAFLVTQARLAPLAEAALSSLDAGLSVDVAMVPEGEGAKSLEAASALYDWLASSRAHRGDVIVSFGGGVVCDLAGFVASTYARGMHLVHVPTTLLAQVDAAIGGKTGVNLKSGKNLVGTFYQPAAVICDVDLLRALPDAELRSGMAEVVKYGLIAEPELLAVVEAEGGALLAGDGALLSTVVERSAAIKAGVVAADEREAGVRAHLNYGHTFGHAIEWVSGCRHGEAVALGMMAAAYLAEELGRIEPHVVDVHRRTLEAVGLPTSATFDAGELEPAWELDKKYRHGVRFVLLRGLGAPEAGVAAPRDAVARAVRRLS